MPAFAKAPPISTMPPAASIRLEGQIQEISTLANAVEAQQRGQRQTIAEL